MAGKQNKSSKHWLTLSIVSLIVIVLIIIGIFSITSSDDSSSIGPTTKVKQGPLTITVSEGGTLEAHNQLIIKDKVRGSRTIIYLIDEGTHVKKGDLLVELDSSDLEDKLVDQEISVENAQADLTKAQQELEITKSQNKSDIADAKQTLEFAKVDLHKYLEGEYPQDLEQAQSDITLAQEELKQSETKLDWSKKLHQKQYISDSELQSDQLSYDQAKMSVKLKQGALELLTKYTYKRQVAQDKSDIKQAEMSLDRTQRQAKANLVQAQASLRAKKAETKRQEDKLADYKERIKNCKIYAPRAGMVIYATTGSNRRRNQEPLAEGQQVHQRQELINLPESGSMIADIKVHESNVDKVNVGQPVQITVDAYPGRTFVGTVKKIAPLPDAQRAWLNPNLKVYDTKIILNGDVTGLRTGMSCQATVIVDHYNNAMYVPVQSVVRVGDQPTVFLVNDNDNVTAQPVKLGLDNNTVVKIASGVSVNDRVLLSPPLDAGKVDKSKRYSKDETEEAKEKTKNTKASEKDQKDSKKEQKQMKEMLDKAKEKGYTPPTAKEVEEGKTRGGLNDSTKQNKTQTNSTDKQSLKPTNKKRIKEWIKKNPEAAKKYAKEHPDAAKRWKNSNSSSRKSHSHSSRGSHSRRLHNSSKTHNSPQTQTSKKFGQE